MAQGLPGALSISAGPHIYLFSALCCYHLLRSLTCCFLTSNTFDLFIAAAEYRDKARFWTLSYAGFLLVLYVAFEHCKTGRILATCM